MAINTAATDQTEETILEVRNATVSFDMERGQSQVLKDVDLDVKRGEILGVVGESGSGKSMLASSLVDAVVDPGITAGEVTYYPEDREPIDILSLSDEDLKNVRWSEVSFLVQAAQSAFNPTMTIRQHFIETLSMHGESIEEGMDRARQLLRDLYLVPDQVLDSYQHELSGGMKQRALIALSLVLEPEVVVMDEPTAALDLLMQRTIVSLIDELQEKYDLTVVFVTHDLDIIGDIADRLAVMYAFDIVEIGPTEELRRHASHPYTRALIKSLPDLNSPLSEMKPIEGSAPDPVDVPDGCKYHPRCPIATDECLTAEPDLTDISEDHRAACYYPEEAVDKIPIQWVEDDIQASEGTTEVGTKSDEVVLSMDDVKIHFDNSKFFGLRGAGTVKAVDGVSLDVHKNEVIAVVGESGCGKTTLGKSAVGLHRPEAGSIQYRGQDIWNAKDASDAWLYSRHDVDIPFSEIRRSLQMIYQNPAEALNSNYTVMSLLSDPLKRWATDLDESDRRARIHGLLEYVGMTPPADYANRYPHQLSGGEQQRVGLVRALLMNPDLIVADEAVSALDVSLRVEMMDLLLELQHQFDTSFLFISHNLSNARYLTKKSGGRIAIMYLGKIVEVGPPEQIINNPQHPYTEALLWATGDFHDNSALDSPPIRSLDIPDPSNQPRGCSFHNRCPEAREHCREQEPAAFEVGGDHQAACFRSRDDSDYWDSDPIEDDQS